MLISCETHCLFPKNVACFALIILAVALAPLPTLPQQRYLAMEKPSQIAMALVLQIASSLNGTAHDRLEYQGAHHSGWHPHRTGRSWFSHPGSISAPKHVTGSMNFANWCIWELLACCLLACCAFVHVCVFVCLCLSLSIWLSIYSTYLSI